MHICFVIYSYGNHSFQPEDLLVKFYSLKGWCDALIDEGCKISVLIRFHQDAHLCVNNVDYHFIKDNYGTQLAFWQIPEKLHQQAKKLDATVFHGHNMNKVLQHAHLKKQIGANRPLLIQNHAETPQKWSRIVLQRFLYKNIDAFLFCAKGQEKIWKNHHLINHRTHLFYVMEGSTDFQYQDRLLARHSTLMQGSPVFLWVGNLNKNKDPLTILQAFATILIGYPTAKLYMAFRFDDLLKEVKQFIKANELLNNAVYLLGELEHNELQNYYNSADYFILGSHSEGSGYSMMEAMACGCIPIVSDIFSFRMMTDNGEIGFLWEVGNAEDLERAIQKALEINIEEARQKVLAFFEKQLSYKAIAKQMVSNYQLIQKYKQE